MSTKVQYFCDYPGCDQHALMEYKGRDYCDRHYEVVIEVDDLSSEHNTPKGVN